MPSKTSAEDPAWPLRDPPVTARGMRTRAALVAAARRVFERAGYIDARLTDIPCEADCSTGTFHTYFSGKEAIFHTVLQAVQDEMRHPGVRHHVARPPRRMP